MDKVPEKFQKQIMKNKKFDTKQKSVLLLVGLVSSFSFISLTKNCFSSAMVFIVDEGLLTKFETGTISAVFYVIYAILQMMSGPLTDRWRPDKLITIGLIGAAVSNLVIYFNQNYVVMLISWAFNAVVQCAVWPSVFKLASTSVCDSMKGKAMFFINICGSLGGILSFVIAAAVSSQWQLNFLISAVGLFVFAVIWEICIAFINPTVSVSESDSQKPDASFRASDAPSFKTVLFGYGILLLFVIAILRSAFDLGLRVLAPSIINESYQSLSPEISTLLSIIVIIAGIFGSLFAGVIYPRFVRNEALVVLLFFLFSFPFVCLMLLVGKVSYVWIVVFLAVMVFLLSTASMFTSSYIASRFGKWNMGGTVAGFVNGGAALGIVLANMAFTAIADAEGWIFTIRVWIVMMAVAILLSCIFLFIWTKFLKKR